MNYDSAQPEEPGVVRGLIAGDYASFNARSVGSAFGRSAIMSGMFNPALGPGLFFPPVMLAHGIPKLAAFAEHPAVAPLLGGHMVMDGMTKKGMLSGVADKYWKKHAGDLNKFTPGGKWSDKLFNFLANEETIATNRSIMGMVARETSVGLKSGIRAGLKQGLKAAGWESSISSKIAASARMGGVVASRVLPMIGWGMFAYDVLQAGRGLYNSVNEMAQQHFESMRSETTMPIVNNTHTLTERRRALASIQQSRLNARSAFGYEAKRLHY